MNHLGRRWHGDRHGGFHLLAAETSKFVTIVAAVVTVVIISNILNVSVARLDDEREVAGARVE